MDKYIKAKDVIEAIKGHTWDDDNDKKLAIEIVQNTPSADTAPIIHAHWETVPERVGRLTCSHCGGAVAYVIGPHYCPFCGAKIDEVAE